MSNANDMAFPVVTDQTRTPNDTEQLGLTKREYIAIEVYKSALANSYAASPEDLPTLFQQASALSVQAADALLAELQKGQS